MTHVVQTLRRRRHGATRGQGGFALLLTLGLMAFFSVVVVALLGMTLNSAGLSTLQAGQATKERAAQSALDTEINRVRDDDSIGAYDGTGSCGASYSPPTRDFDGETTTVDCEALEPSPEVLPEAATTKSAKVISAGTYRGGVAGGPTSTLRAEGDPTRFTGVVQVKQAGEGPIQVGGTYAQGDGTPCVATVVGGSPTCGDTTAAVLGDSAELVNPPIWSASAVRDAPKPVVPSNCTNPVTVLQPGSYSKDLTRALNGLLASVGCAGKTVRFEPGNYWIDARDDTASSPDVNAVVIDNDVTVVFGEFLGASRTMCDPSTGLVDVTLSPRTNLVHRRGTVEICGAVRQPSAPPSPTQFVDPNVQAVPPDSESCQADRVSNLFSLPGGGLPATAIFQVDRRFPWDVRLDCWYQDTASLEFTLPMNPADAPINSAVVQMRGAGNFANGRGASIRFDVTTPSSHACSATFSRMPDDDVMAAYDLIAQPGSTCSSVLRTRADLSGAKVKVVFTVHAFVYDSNPTYPSGCGSTSGYQVQWMCVRIDAFSVQSGWKLSATSHQTPSAHSAGSGWGSIDNLLPGPPDSPAELTVPTTDSLRTFTADFAGFDESAFDPYLPSVDGLSSLGVLVSGRSSLYAYPGTDPSQPTSVAAVTNAKLQPEHEDPTYVAVQLRLTRSDGSSLLCGGAARGLPLWGESVFVDLISQQLPAGPSSPCPGGLNSKELLGAEISVVTRVGNRSSQMRAYRDFMSPPPFIPIPAVASTESIDSVSLVAVPAGGYTHPGQVNSITGSGNGSFHVNNWFSTPRNDLDVSWNGGLADPLRPVVDGNLVVSGLGSQQFGAGEVGIVCCIRGKHVDRRLKLTASIGSGAVASTTIRVLDYDPGGGTQPGFGVNVDRWTICRARPADCPP